MSKDYLFDEKFELNLPKLKGTVSQGFDLSRLSWLKVGGPAQFLFQPEDENDLASFLGNLPEEIPTFVIGACSNLIIRDGGIPGVVIRLGSSFSNVKFGEKTITIGAACLDSKVAQISAKNGIDLSFLRTIPGKIGGAVAMNAGCHGSYISDYFVNLKVVMRDGSRAFLNLKDLHFKYRSSAIPAGAVITEITLRSYKDFQKNIERKMSEFLAYREKHQPVKELSCGSTFRNPLGRSSTGSKTDNDHSLKAWKLIDMVGLRGARIGGARISDKHPNFMINTGDATAKNLEDLGSLVIKKVREKMGIELVWEIKRVGCHAQDLY